MTQMLAQREHDYFAETVICANCYIVTIIFGNDIAVGINMAITVISYAPVGHSYFHTLNYKITLIRPRLLRSHPLYLRGGACKPFYRKTFCF